MPELTPTIEEQIKSTILEAIDKAHIEQVEIIQKTIQEKVNGKIDKLQAHMNEQDVKLDETNMKLEAISKEQVRVKNDTDPLINIRTVAISLGKFIMWIGGIILILSALYKVIWYK